LLLGPLLLLLLQRANYEDAIQLDGSWEKAHFSYAVYLDSLYRDAKQREVRYHGLYNMALLRCFTAKSSV
jgi:hypothetical protein